MGDISNFASDKNCNSLGLLAREIETLLCEDSSIEYLSVSTQQHIYIKAFIQLYMIYIKYVILNKLSAIVSNMDLIKIGYNVTVERILLNCLFDSKEDLKDIIYSSGLIQRFDDFKKLRITTQEERILPLIQQYLSLKFPLKSFFVLAQLHEDYIQLSLNQVVTEFNKDGNQEAIIVRDKTIRIRNIYDSVCLSMWNKIVEDNSLIHFCDIHNKNDNETFDIFSFKNQVKFTSNLKQYISKNVSIKYSQYSAFSVSNILVRLSYRTSTIIYVIKLLTSVLYG